MKKLAKVVREVRAIAIENGRAATDVDLFPMIASIVGRAVEEAQDDSYEADADWEGGLATISSFMNVEYSKCPVDEPFDVEGLKERISAIQSLIACAKTYARHEGSRLRPECWDMRLRFVGMDSSMWGRRRALRMFSKAS
jgi:alkanesulfonate monooxygenase SsuD/methylene tetrahydromethanopterin reductase-like flavin-dependent oxidoreductase (luciferase family)